MSDATIFIATATGYITAVTGLLVAMTKFRKQLQNEEKDDNK
jgi:hypothetical protein